jgi:hypothetical protein
MFSEECLVIVNTHKILFHGNAIERALIGVAPPIEIVDVVPTILFIISI